MKQSKTYIIIILLLTVLIIPSVAIAAWWNPFSWNIWQNIWNSIFYKQTSIIQPVPTTCTPKWICGWGPCTNGTQSMTAIDSNNCGLPPTDVRIACPALARICNFSSQTAGQVTRKVGEKEFNFLIKKINTDSVDGLLYTLYPVAKLQGDAKTLHIGDAVGYTCEGKTATLSNIDVVNQTVIFNETIKNAPPGGCPI